MRKIGGWRTLDFPSKIQKVIGYFQKVIGRGGESGLRSRHIAARPGPLEVPMIATLISCRRLQAALRGSLRRLASQP
jgi:hypothetical protein